MSIQTVIRAGGFEFRSDFRIISSEFDEEASKFVNKLKSIPGTETSIVLSQPFSKMDPQFASGIMGGDESCIGLIPCHILWINDKKEIVDSINGFIGQVPALEPEEETEPA